MTDKFAGAKSLSLLDRQSSRIPSSTERVVGRAVSKVFDFVVVGIGTTGKAAVLEIQKTCPNATIALVDPFVVTVGDDKPPTTTQTVSAWVTSLDPLNRRVKLQDFRASSASTFLSYRYGVLLATGSKGAPPPHYLMDEAALDHVLELRSTVLPHPQQLRRIQSTAQVREQVLTEAAQGKRIAVLGSGWEALDLAASIVTRTKEQSSPRRGGRAVLVFGRAIPLGHVLPNYLGSAVSKRLRSRKVAVHDRTVVRYISHEKGIPTPDICNNAITSGSLQLYTAKSYDLLDSHMDKVDHIVVAPDVSGSRGNAVLPTDEIPSYLQDQAKGRSWYRPWSLLLAPQQHLACYKDDGRVAVNSELCACDGVYAAGSVAKYPNGINGHAEVAGYGFVDGTLSGQVAAWNMTRQYRSRNLSSKIEPTMLKDPIPVFRSDRLSIGNGCKSALFSLGINALCVGTCDSERFFTHGVWWTNLAAQRRLLHWNESPQGGDTPMRRRKSMADSQRSVYGIGVVYYLDRTGKIQGIMTWGLPLTTGSGSHLNPSIVALMKDIIVSNGGLRSVISEADRIRLSKFLTQQSRNLVATAFAGYNNMESEESITPQNELLIAQEMKILAKPLHRFTEPRPPSVRQHGLLQRKDGNALGVLGEDLFAKVPRDENLDEALMIGSTLGIENLSHPNVESSVTSSTMNTSDSMSEWNRWEQTERQWDENEEQARPAKEDMIWLRKGDEMRSTAARENLLSAYNKAIWSSSSKSSRGQ